MIAPTSTMLAYLPSPPQGVWDIGPFPLRAYALCIIVGIIVAVWWGNRRWMARGGQDGEVLDVAIWAVPFGLVGGRLYHLITDWKTYFGADALKEPIDALKIWDGGLGIWGAVALGAVGAWIGARRRGIRLPAFGDAIAPPILLAQAIGRVGNYFNQELYGRETTLPWGLEIYERQNAAGYSDPGLIDGVSNGVVVAVVHPTFLYELLWNVLIVVLLVVVDRYFRIGHGRLFALYVAGYCLGRFFVELLRDDRAAVANDIAGIRPNLFTAALVFLAAVIYFVVAPKGREQGLEMYNDDRAAELAEQGVAGYVDDWYDEDAEPETTPAVVAGGAAASASGSSLFEADGPDRSAGTPVAVDEVVAGDTADDSDDSDDTVSAEAASDAAGPDATESEPEESAPAADTAEPESEVSDAAEPESEVSDAAEPESEVSDAAEPETEVSEAAASPDTAADESDTDGSGAAETTAPDDDATDNADAPDNTATDNADAPDNPATDDDATDAASDSAVADDPAGDDEPTGDDPAGDDPVGDDEPAAEPGTVDEAGADSATNAPDETDSVDPVDTPNDADPGTSGGARS
ncbi:prolipoprotein diacylglyceryl transferase [Gordonia McavH-238-E]|uniref:prolipoprotein diacylglyceryl transferase n=1 Tax=Gordonia sp. McavH-238-E TaxID=2917736 RepID=UPI001EF58F26|nr:prolipoprotein diacylglyceryl transferase [Gordonia sp. McavH-238-E]MCG7632390.1 prolipoprotein diacylglyceryl transferase [Gordonia sp. McavH-238-E]